MLGSVFARRAAGVTAILIAVVSLTGCPKEPQFAMEEPGRPAVTWQNDRGEVPTPGEEHAQQTAERALLAQIHEAERTGTDELSLADGFYNLAILRRQQGEFAEAERLYRKALDIRERKEGRDAPNVATTLNNLAGLLASQGDYEAAQPMLERALSIRRIALGNTHVLTAESMSNLALLYAAQGNTTAAEPLYQQAIAILEKTDGPRQGELDRVLDNYAAMLHETGRDTEAGGLEARARLIRAAAEQQTGATH